MKKNKTVSEFSNSNFEKNYALVKSKFSSVNKKNQILNANNLLIKSSVTETNTITALSASDFDQKKDPSFFLKFLNTYKHKSFFLFERNKRISLVFKRIGESYFWKIASILIVFIDCTFLFFYNSETVIDDSEFTSFFYLNIFLKFFLKACL